MQDKTFGKEYLNCHGPISSHSALQEFSQILMPSPDLEPHLALCQHPGDW
ncbi:hypothetical protein LEMLEM_LOCUS21745 [Lemmus lemmus]